MVFSLASKKIVFESSNKGNLIKELNLKNTYNDIFKNKDLFLEKLYESCFDDEVLFDENEKKYSEIKDIIKTSGVSCIIVTHHIDDATSMADRIAILKDGKLIQINTSKIIFDNPASEYVAKLFGTVNQLDGVFFRAKDLILGEGNRVAAVRESYFENGQLETVGNFDNGLRIGKWNYYYQKHLSLQCQL